MSRDDWFLHFPDIKNLYRYKCISSGVNVCILTQALGDHVRVAGERLPVEDEGLGGHQKLPQLGIQVLHLHNTLQSYLNIH
jgi:hypothetical protein